MLTLDENLDVCSFQLDIVALYTLNCNYISIYVDILFFYRISQPLFISLPSRGIVQALFLLGFQSNHT